MPLLATALAELERLKICTMRLVSVAHSLPALSSPHLFYKSNTLKSKFSGSPVVKTLTSSVGGMGSILGQGAKIPHASGPQNQNHKT